MNAVESFVKAVQQEYNPAQPWRNIPPSKLRPNLNNSLRRKGRKPGTLRRAGIESIASTCERYLVLGMLGISAWKEVDPQNIYLSKGGDVFQSHLEEIFRGSPNWIIGGDRADPSKPWERNGHVGHWLKTPYEDIAGVAKKVFNGSFDFYYKPTNQILDLKIIPEGEEVPRHAKKKGIRQLAIYITNHPTAAGGSLVYLPENLETLNYDDLDSFYSFHLTKEQARKILKEEIEPVLNNALEKITWRGNDQYPYHSPQWFLRITKNLPICDNPYCCIRHIKFLKTISINEDWTFDTIDIF